MNVIQLDVYRATKERRRSWSVPMFLGGVYLSVLMCLAFQWFGMWR